MAEKKEVKKTAKKAPSKKKVVKKAEVEVVEKNLTSAEMLMMDLNNEKNKVEKLEIEKLEMQKAIEKLKKEVLAYKMKELDDAVSALGKKQVERMNADKMRKAQHKSFMDELKSKYGIKSDKWGFNPDTGEIIEG